MLKTDASLVSMVFSMTMKLLRLAILHHQVPPMSLLIFSLVPTLPITTFKKIYLLSGESDTLSECDVDIILANFRDDIDARTLPADTPAPDALAIHASATETTAADTTCIIEEIDLLSGESDTLAECDVDITLANFRDNIDDRTVPGHTAAPDTTSMLDELGLLYEVTDKRSEWDDDMMRASFGE